MVAPDMTQKSEQGADEVPKTSVSLGFAATPASAADLKACCATLYESDWAKLLLGDSFHPGGLQLTERLGTLLRLQPGMTVLDVASGPGSSALFLAERFGCQVVGVDYSHESVAAANDAAAAAQLVHLVHFQQADAEELPFDDDQFDAIICECAFCTFPNKAAAAAEFKRVLAPGSRIGISDLTRQGDLPPELHSLLAWIACIADALPIDGYRAFLQQAGLQVSTIESHPEALRQLVHDIRGKLVGAELLLKLRQIDLPGVVKVPKTSAFAEAKRIARAAAGSVEAGNLNYAIMIAG
jgi:ubiquinone/menaquinone biosynthesis C-methylase UbiE